MSISNTSTTNNNLNKNLPHPEFCKLLRYHNDTISQLSFNPNNKQLVSSSYDHTIMLWDISNTSSQKHKIPLIGRGHKSLINDMSISPNGFYIATASSDHTVRIWSNTYDYSSTKNNIQSSILKFNTVPVKSVDFSCDSRLICTGSDDKTVKIISIADKKLLANLTGHSNWVKSTRFSKDSKLIASGSDDRTLRFWDTQTKKNCYSFQNNEHKGSVNCVRFHPDNSCVATACQDKLIRLFDVRSKRLVQTYKYHMRPATSCAFHPNGYYMASTSYDGTVKVYDLRIGDVLFTLFAHESAVMSCDFSVFGDYFVSGGMDSNIVLWESNLEFYNGNKFLMNSSSNDNSNTLNYKYHGFKENVVSNNNNNMSSSNSNISEGLTNVFDKMVSQMEMITNSFVNFEKRITAMEDVVEQMNQDDINNNLVPQQQ
jgi:centriolar protein POC1